MTGDIGTVQRGHCGTCGAHIALTRFGLVRQHRTRRVDSRAREYVAEDMCTGANEPPMPLDGAQ